LVVLPESMSNAGQGLTQHFEALGGTFTAIVSCPRAPL
jgi:hypothetical protein